MEHSDARGTGPERVKVWDPFVRVCHWSSAILVVLLVITAKLGLQETHMALGIDLSVLVAARFAWGFIGPRHARFASFIPRPRQSLRYLREIMGGRPARHFGHNPAGAVMVLTLLAAIATILMSGFFLQATLEFEGPLTELLRPATDAAVDEVWTLHRWVVDALYVLVALHLLGVLLASIQHRENLPWSMVTGYKARKTRE